MSPQHLGGACALGGYLVVVGFFGGMVYSAMRFDGERAAVLSKLEDESTRVHSHLMRLEREDAQGAEPRGESVRSAVLDASEGPGAP